LCFEDFLFALLGALLAGKVVNDHRLSSAVILRIALRDIIRAIRTKQHPPLGV
jgi:hypothetical protein